VSKPISSPYPATVPRTPRRSLGSRVRREWGRNKYVYLMLLPVVAYFVIFKYVPMYGAIIAFKDYSPALGIWESPWVGMKWFRDFFNSFYFWRLVENTFMINLYGLLFAFPAPIILALLLNELTSERFKRLVQTVTYLPHFVSTVVIVGIVLDFLARDGLINQLVMAFGGEPVGFMSEPRFFRSVYVGSGIWEGIGWGSIIYLAALTGIDANLYEAAKVDGANRWQQMLHITLPGFLPIIMIMLILNFGEMFEVGFEKIILLYNPSVYETGDVIASFTYRRGLLGANYSYGAAIGLFNAVVNMTLLVIANRLSRRFTETSLW